MLVIFNKMEKIVNRHAFFVGCKNGRKGELIFNSIVERQVFYVEIYFFKDLIIANCA